MFVNKFCLQFLPFIIVADIYKVIRYKIVRILLKKKTNINKCIFNYFKLHKKLHIYLQKKMHEQN